MKDNTLSKLGGNSSILLGISYLVIGITYLLLPADQKQTSALDKFLPSFAQNPTTQIIQWWVFAPQWTACHRSSPGSVGEHTIRE